MCKLSYLTNVGSSGGGEVRIKLGGTLGVEDGCDEGVKLGCIEGFELGDSLGISDGCNEGYQKAHREYNQVYQICAESRDLIRN